MTWVVKRTLGTYHTTSLYFLSEKEKGGEGSDLVSK